MSFKALLKSYQQRVDAELEPHLTSAPADPRLQEAMRYSCFNGGKRLRPVLVYAANQVLGGELSQADPAACALELIHAYSLIHDDLPAMDDDDLRRGQPTCHIAFDEATAILAGDALQALAFELLAVEQPDLTPRTQLRMLRTLAEASGDKGLVAGQAIDLGAVGQSLSLLELERMHRHKTGALIRAAVQLGALSSGQAADGQLQVLDRYATAIGLAFQVQDDILDVESDTETLGKRQGADSARNKPTYPNLLGLEGAREKARALHREAQQALDELTGSAVDGPILLLRQLADYIIQRDH